MPLVNLVLSEIAQKASSMPAFRVSSTGSNSVNIVTKRGTMHISSQDDSYNVNAYGNTTNVQKSDLGTAISRNI